MVDTLHLGAFHIAKWFQMVNVLHSGLSFKSTGYWLVNIESLWMVDSDKNVVSWGFWFLPSSTTHTVLE